MSYRHSFSVVHIRIRCFWAVARRELAKIHRCYGRSCQSQHLGSCFLFTYRRCQYIWKKKGRICLAQDRDKLYNTCICLKGLRETMHINQGSWYPLRFKLGTYQTQAPGSIGSETSYLWSSLWFLFTASANSGLEPQISSWPLPSTSFYNSLFINHTTIPASLNKTNTGTWYSVEIHAISILRKGYRVQYQYWHSALGANC